MMKIALLSIGILLFVVNVSAQTYYYNEIKTIKEKKYTYQCDVNDSTKMVTLYNINDEMAYIDLVNEQREKLYQRSENNPNKYVESAWIEPEHTFFISHSFSKAQIRRLQGYKLGVIMCIRTAD